MSMFIIQVFQVYCIIFTNFLYSIVLYTKRFERFFQLLNYNYYNLFKNKN